MRIRYYYSIVWQKVNGALFFEVIKDFGMLALFGA